jgi:PleD family two-component response regulator
MLEYNGLFTDEYVRPHKMILMLVKDAKIGSFLLRVINRERKYHAFLVSHEHQVLQVVQEVKPDLFVLDCDFSRGKRLDLYDRLHVTKGLENIPAILCDFSTRFSSRQRKRQELQDYDEPSALESFFYTIQEVLT